MIRILRDWWRGYSDLDYESMLEKLASPQFKPPGDITYISAAELRAYHAMHRNMAR